MSTQKADVLNYIQTYGGLTRMEAFSQLGVTELAARIGELEKEGHVFTRKWINGKAANGRAWRVVRYGLAMNASERTPQERRTTSQSMGAAGSFA